MKKSIAKNYLYNLTYQILIIIIPLITTPYLSRVLGAENIGIYSYTLSITTYFILFGSLGVSLYGQREIAYLQENKNKRSKTLFEIFLLKLITLSMSMIIFYFAFCNYGKYIIYYKILILEIIANIVDISWFFQGLEEFKKTVIRNIIIRLISVICIFLFVKNSNDLKIYFFIYVLSNLLGNLSLWLYLPKYVEKISIKKLNIIKHLKPTIALFIPQIAIQIYTILDKTMIGAIVENKAEVGYYEQAQKAIKLLMTIATSFGTVMAPRMANIFSKGDKVKLKKYMITSLSFIMLLAFPLTYGIISIADNFVPLFYGKGYDKVIILIKVISPIIVIIGISNVIGNQYLMPTKQQQKYTISVISGAVVNAILNFILINKYASIGASIATVIAELTVTGMQLYLVRKDIDIKELLHVLYKYLIAAIIMFLFSIFIDYLITSKFISIVVQIIISVIVYFALLILLKDKLVLDSIKIVKNKIKKYN